ncbi:hypothetical protein ACI3KT_08635 [Microbacterium sp. ZW T6_19]
MTTLGRWWNRTADWMGDLAEDDTGDVPGWVLVTLMKGGAPCLRHSLPHD